MIEKLTTYPRPLPNNPTVVENIGMDNKSLFDKINELVDAVNAMQNLWVEVAMVKKIILELQTSPENVQPDTESRTENVQDKFAEQRKWIGCLCRFWDDDAFVTSNDWAFGILTSIDKGMQFQYCCNENCNFKHCEPVKPDDDIIYKGGDNE